MFPFCDATRKNKAAFGLLITEEKTNPGLNPRVKMLKGQQFPTIFFGSLKNTTF